MVIHHLANGNFPYVVFPWQAKARHSEPFAYRAFRRRRHRIPQTEPAWLVFLDGWKARALSQPVKGFLRQVNFWSGHRLLSHKGRNLGKFKTKAGAEKRERQIDYFRSLRKKRR